MFFRCQLCISRKVKKSESKSQLPGSIFRIDDSCVYLVKLKNLKANHNRLMPLLFILLVVYIS